VSVVPAGRRCRAAITHDSQTEGYYILSGGGTLITGGRIVNGNKSGSEATITKGARTGPRAAE
jgi:mannose-6-phosphate isomerase-like protein (cupin superfamily)